MCWRHCSFSYLAPNAKVDPCHPSFIGAEGGRYSRVGGSFSFFFMGKHQCTVMALRIIDIKLY